MWSIDVPVPPDAAVARVRDAINRPPKRALGVLKVENEYVGVVTRDEFEIWERRQSAIHAVGRVRARGRGSRVGVEFHVTPRTRVLAVLFFVLYVLAAVQFLAYRGSVGALDVLVALAGAALTGGFFALSARRQRADLRSFLERVYAL